MQLPLTKDEPKHQWHPDLVAYWQRFGDQIGVEAAPYPAPAVAAMRMRAVAVRPVVTLSIAPQDLNIIVQRLEPLPDAERFDLIVATNILVYYDAFEQALALANIAKMLRPGRLLRHQLRRLAAPAAGAVREHRHVGVLRQAAKRRHDLLLSEDGSVADADSDGNWNRIDGLIDAIVLLGRRPLG